MTCLFVSGVCPEPGGVPFSTRTRYNGPYNPGDHVTYSCLEGGGGGTITCQRDGTWTRKPGCSGERICVCMCVCVCVCMCVRVACLCVRRVCQHVVHVCVARVCVWHTRGNVCATCVFLCVCVVRVFACPRLLLGCFSDTREVPMKAASVSKNWFILPVKFSNFHTTCQASKTSCQ